MFPEWFTIMTVIINVVVSFIYLSVKVDNKRLKLELSDIRSKQNESNL